MTTMPPNVTWTLVVAPAVCPACRAKVALPEEAASSAAACAHHIAVVGLGDAIGLARAWGAREELVLQSYCDRPGLPQERWFAFRRPLPAREKGAA